MSNHASFIWNIADLLRGTFKSHQYGDFILPFTVLRRLDSVLADTKPKVLEVVAEAEEKGMLVRPVLLKTQAGHQHSFYNTSPYDLGTLIGDPENLRENLLATRRLGMGASQGPGKRTGRIPAPTKRKRQATVRTPGPP